MSRPLYETPATLSLEAATANRICCAWGIDLVKLPIRYNLDHLGFTKGTSQSVCWVEIKNRPGYSWDHITQLGGYMLSYHKWQTGLMMMNETLPFVLAVCDNQNDLRCLIVRSTIGTGFPVRMGGRSDRSDDQDIEPVIIIPVEKFDIRIK